MSEQNYEHLSASEQKKEDWMNSKWRPMMGWLYMGVCAFDFVVFPILWSLLQALSKGAVNTQWQPLTLQGAGLFHIAMGAVLGIAALGRTQEKLAGANNGGAQLGTTYVPPSPTTPGGVTNGGFNTPSSSPTAFSSAPATGFGSPSQSFAAAPTGFGSAPATGFGQVTTGFGGKPAPVQPDQPLI